MSESSKAQIATILSALDGRRRSPANRAEGLRALAKSAARHGCTVGDVLAAAPGLLDGRLTPEAFRAELAERVDAPTAVPEATDEAQVPAPADASAPEAAAVATAPMPNKAPTIRPGTKQALLVAMLRRPEGATVAQIAAATGWQLHTVRGAISGALKKKLGLPVEAVRITAVGANSTGATGSITVYKIKA